MGSHVAERDEMGRQPGVQRLLLALPPISLGVHLLAEAARRTRFHARAAASAETA